MEEHHTFPEYISYLLDPDTPLDFKINIGNPETTTPVQFGVVKWMLIARSKVFRVMLLESKLKHKEEFNIPDMDPVTFRNFLMFVYGYDNFFYHLSFEDAVKLLNPAEKYDVQELKELLGDLITSLLTVKNLFVVLKHGLVCEKIPKLWARVTQLIQSHTGEVFLRPDFLRASPEAVVHILQQECLNVPEIYVWRAALKWATHRVNRQGGAASPGSLRSTMLPLLQHTRLCTLSPKELCREVIPAKVLMHEEIVQLCRYLYKQGPPSSLQICNIKEKRGCFTEFDETTFKIRNRMTGHKLRQSSLYLMTKEPYDVELTGLMCQANSGVTGETYLCECKVKVALQADLRNNTSTVPRVEVTFSDRVECGVDFIIPVRAVLHADMIYAIQFEFSVEHSTFIGGLAQFSADSHRYSPNLFVWHGDHLKTLHYRLRAN